MPAQRGIDVAGWPPDAGPADIAHRSGCAVPRSAGATSGKGSGMVGYNVQTAVDTQHHLIVAHEVTNKGTDKSLLSHMAKRTKAALETDALEVVADRGYFKSKEILACAEAVRHDQILDGLYPLPDENAETGRHRNGTACARL